MVSGDQLKGAVRYLEGNDAKTGTGPGRAAAWEVVEEAAKQLDNQPCQHEYNSGERRCRKCGVHADGW